VTAVASSSTRTAVPDSSAGRAVTRLALRQVRRGALVVAGLAGAMSAVVVAGYRSTVRNDLDAAALAALAENPAIWTLQAKFPRVA